MFALKRSKGPFTPAIYQVYTIAKKLFSPGNVYTTHY